MTFIFLHAFHLKFTINANIVYIPVESKFSMLDPVQNHALHRFSVRTEHLLLPVYVS